MPTYDYECKKCGKQFEVVTTIRDHDKKKPRCPECSSEEVEQVMEEFFAITTKKS